MIAHIFLSRELILVLTVKRNLRYLAKLRNLSENQESHEKIWVKVGSASVGVGHLCLPHEAKMAAASSPQPSSRIRIFSRPMVVPGSYLLPHSIPARPSSHTFPSNACLNCFSLLRANHSFGKVGLSNASQGCQLFTREIWERKKNLVVNSGAGIRATWLVFV